MKRSVLITAAFVLVLTGCALAMVLALSRPKLSMKLVEYRQWPHGAIVRLTNGTRMTIRYLAEPDVTPRGSPLLHARKTTNGWTTASTVLRTVALMNPVTGKPSDFFFLVNPAAPPKAGDHLESVFTHELAPGQSVDFFVRLEPAGTAERIGTLCLVPQSGLATKLQPWLSRIKQWCRIKTTGLGQTVPGQVEVWCPDSLCITASVQPK